jgi:hypothetical protein
MERGQFQCIFVCFCTTIDEEKAIILVSASLAQASGELFLQGVLYGIAVEAQCVQLLGHSFCIMRMAMTYADDSVAAIEVKIFLSFGVPNGASFATSNGYVHEGIYVE